MNSNEFNSKEHTVKRVFNEVFDKYDLMNDIMSFGIHRVWKKKFINILNPQKKTKLIDVATGTGDIAKLYLDKIHSKGNAYCVDENKEMLKLNKQKNDNNSNIKENFNSVNIIFIIKIVLGICRKYPKNSNNYNIKLFHFLISAYKLRNKITV